MKVMPSAQAAAALLAARDECRRFIKAFGPEAGAQLFVEGHGFDQAAQVYGAEVLAELTRSPAPASRCNVRPPGLPPPPAVGRALGDGRWGGRPGRRRR